MLTLPHRCDMGCTPEWHQDLHQAHMTSQGRYMPARFATDRRYSLRADEQPGDCLPSHSWVRSRSIARTESTTSVALRHDVLELYTHYKLHRSYIDTNVTPPLP